MMERYLVTGAQGFAGRYLVEEMLAGGACAIFGIGRSARREPAAWTASEKYAYAPVDIRDTRALAEIIRDFQPTTVIHLASGLRDDPPQALLQVNVLGTLSLIEAIDRAGLVSPRLIVGSSGGVYGRLRGRSFAEDAACEPVEIYSASKLAQEHVARTVGSTRGLDVVVARLFNIIGAGQDERHACSRFARQLVDAARTNDGARIEVGDLTPTRDFIDVRDVASALLLLARRGRSGATYNVASGIETSIEELLRLTCEAAGLPTCPQLARTYLRAADIPRHVADIRKLVELGFRPRFALKRSVTDLVAYYTTAGALETRKAG